MSFFVKRGEKLSERPLQTMYPENPLCHFACHTLEGGLSKTLRIRFLSRGGSAKIPQKSSWKIVESGKDGRQGYSGIRSIWNPPCVQNYLGSRKEEISIQESLCTRISDGFETKRLDVSEKLKLRFTDCCGQGLRIQKLSSRTRGKAFLGNNLL